MQNLLFITIDDFFSLSAWPMYDDIAVTPNLDAFQSNSANFSAAFSDVALCNPSRTSILTGQTPWQTGVLTNTQDMGHLVDFETETLPGILKSSGMYTALGGKVFHTLPADQRENVADEILNSSGLRNSNSPDFESVNDTHYGTTTQELSDDVLVDSANAFMENHDGDEPFALFAGIYRPHADWIVPQEYLDLYKDIEIPIPDFVDDADRAEFLSALPRPFHDEVVDNAAWESLVRHYLASLSYADAKLGELLEGLDDSGYADNTVTVVMSDHGYHLGDASLWHKFTTYEQSARAPLAISVPGLEPVEVTAPVNLSGVAATVLELLDIPVPDQMVPSLTGYIEGDTGTGSEFALTWMNGSVSVRTENYRYTLYETGEEELFDIRTDIMNIVNLVDARPNVVAAHRELANAAIGDDLFIRPETDVFGDEDDTVYYLHLSDVQITDAGGDDTVFFAGDYTLQEGLENLHGIEAEFGLTLTGNTADNRISGALDDDVLNGLAGDDHLFGAAGADTVSGGAGDDFVAGGPGDDLVRGGLGNDRVEGNFGKDQLFGGDGDDELNGAAGNDTLMGEAGDDTLIGSSGNDRLDGGIGDDLLDGGDGWDVLNGGNGIDMASFTGESKNYAVFSGTIDDFRIDGTDGRDQLIGVELLRFNDRTVTVEEFFAPVSAIVSFGTASADTIQTWRGDDAVVGRDGNDVLSTYGGNDTLRGGSGNDILDGGAGEDTAVYQGATASVSVYLNFGMSEGAQGGDKLINIENLVGSRFDDWLAGDNLGNQLEGGRGDDTFRGHGGKDVIVGAQGNDLLEGGTGDDMLSGGLGDDRLDGEDDDDEIIGGQGDDLLFGGEGADALDGGDGNDVLFGEQGADELLGFAGDDLLRGNLGDDLLHGGTGHDNIRGGGDNDVLFGEAGNDALFGEAGSDILHGNGGDDVLHGGVGGGTYDGYSDEFVFGQIAQGYGGFNHIRDFEDGLDRLDLSRFEFDSFDTDILPLASERGEGADLALVFEDGYVVYIDNFSLAQFDASDVIF